jgi:hypothetical protein
VFWLIACVSVLICLLAAGPVVAQAPPPEIQRAPPQPSDETPAAEDQDPQQSEQESPPQTQDESAKKTQDESPEETQDEKTGEAQDESAAESSEPDSSDTSQRDLFQGGWTSDSTSDDFQRGEWLLSYRNHRRDFVWPWEEAGATALDWGVDARDISGSLLSKHFEGRRFAAMLGKLLRPMYAELWLGSDHLGASGPSKDIFIYDGTLRFQPNSVLDIRVQSKRDFAYRDVLLPGGITDFLVLTKHGADVQWRPRPRLRTEANIEWRMLNDGNRARHYEGSLLYGVSPGTPWIWAGLGGEWLEYNRQVSTYWSPERFYAYGLRVDCSFSLSKRLEADLSANLDIEKEAHFRRNLGEYVDAGIAYHFASRWLLHLSVQLVRSQQVGHSWRQTTGLLSVAGSL